MHSSFLILVNAGLALYSSVLFLKLITQFGLPNHPARFTAYIISLCASAFFVMDSLAEFSVIGPMELMKWRALPLVCGSLGILFQAMLLSHKLTFIQQKVISRIPLMAGLVCFSFFPSKADIFAAASIVAGGIFLSVSVGKARYQKRLFMKMIFFLLVTYLCRLPGNSWVIVLSQCFLYFAVFYFFLFEHTFGISALVEGRTR